MNEIQPLLDNILVSCAIAKQEQSPTIQIQNIESTMSLIYKFLELKQPSEEAIQGLLQPQL